MAETWWLSSKRMTVGVDVVDGEIVAAAPIVRKFIGQPLGNLLAWMNRQGGFRAHRLESWDSDRKEKQ